MPSIAGTERGNLLKIRPHNLVIDWALNSSRDDFDREELAESKIPALAETIRTQGWLISSVIEVERIIGDYKTTDGRKFYGPKDTESADALWLVRAGFSRSEAAQQAEKAGWDGFVQAVPHGRGKLDDVEAIIHNVRENSDRTDISHFGLAKACKLLADKGLKPEEIAKRIGRVEDDIRDHLKLNDAHKDVKTALRAGDLPWSIVRVLVRKTNERPAEKLNVPSEQEAALDAALNARKAGGNTEAVRSLIHQMTGSKRKGDATGSKKVDREVEKAKETISRAAPGASRLVAVYQQAQARLLSLQHNQSKLSKRDPDYRVYEGRISECRYTMKLLLSAVEEAGLDKDTVKAEAKEAAQA